MKKPKLYVIADPNGSGKTTFAEKFLPDYVECFEFINADLIAKGLSPFDPSRVAIKAGKLLLEQIQAYSKRRIDFAFETTFSGKNYKKVLKNIKKKGFELHLFFLWLPDVKLALARVADRVREGGHHVLEKDVRRRYVRGLWNLFHVYKTLFDSWSIFDTATTHPKQIVKSEQNILTVYDKMNYQQLLKQAGVCYGT
ncbi:MAG: Zeta toxin family protein [Candidatus Omnitrophica bacterium CG11_big_fil_rev_8_21_14_0_20_45_26]|uniref:Zeta toxin family protein n=1 Tax=Candidatus Abzuiibacterium crystallinum TaxID=1974748 RepID=A0A2H0LSQ8_9BACT|nr:MAG: Zeta toxin family protein [Candidatus Omnitrophica bacterium CG11_big_fil_rev_8_21_14_0_20_45_26]